MDAFDLVSKERVDTLRPACRPRAKNEVWILAGTSDPQRRPEGDQGRCTGCMGRERARPSPSVT
eukprot:scaffold17906_cov44-Phaeocystis_antarctica.AAC.1